MLFIFRKADKGICKPFVFGFQIFNKRGVLIEIKRHALFCVIQLEHCIIGSHGFAAGAGHDNKVYFGLLHVAGKGLGILRIDGSFNIFPDFRNGVFG